MRNRNRKKMCVFISEQKYVLTRSYKNSMQMFAIWACCHNYFFYFDSNLKRWTGHVKRKKESRARRIHIFFTFMSDGSEFLITELFFFSFVHSFVRRLTFFFLSGVHQTHSPLHTDTLQTHSHGKQLNRWNWTNKYL